MNSTCVLLLPELRSKGLNRGGKLYALDIKKNQCKISISFVIEFFEFFSIRQFGLLTKLRFVFLRRLLRVILTTVSDGV